MKGFLKRLKIRYIRRLKQARFHFTWTRLAVVSLISVLIVAGVWVFLNYDTITKTITFNTQKNKSSFPAQEDKWKNEPNRLEIPSLGVIGKVIYPTSISELNSSLDKGINHYPGTSEPSGTGNVVLTAHSSSLVPGYYSNIFATIEKLQPGEQLYLIRNNIKYAYQLTSKKVIAATDYNYVDSSTASEQLTLITCWPIGTDLQRYVIVAKRLY